MDTITMITYMIKKILPSGFMDIWDFCNVQLGLHVLSWENATSLYWINIMLGDF